MNKKLLFSVALTSALIGCGGDGGSSNPPDDDDTPANVAGSVALSGDATVGATLTAAVTDSNGVPDAVTYAWSADGTAIDGATSSEFVLTEAQTGAAVTVTASYTDDDGYSESVTSDATDAVAAANQAATFEGLTASVLNDVTAPATGTITVTDTTPEDSVLVALSDQTTQYGTFSVTAEGAWSYTLDTSDANVAGLTPESDPLTDTIDIESADGTQAEFVVTITGAAVVVTTTQVATITDTSTEDTGELRYALGDDGPLLAGRLNVSFNKDADTLGSDGNIKDAYITLFNTDTSTSSGRAILDLRIQDDNFAIRDQDDITVSNPFTPGEWQDVEVTWEAADETSAPVLTITIDGVAVTTEPYTGSATAVGGVTHVAFRFADNSRTVTGAYRVDDVEVYSDTAGTNLLFEDDFEGYTAGDSLASDNANSPYNSATFEAVVEEVNLSGGSDGGGDDGGGDDGGSGDSGPGTSGNLMAEITDTSTEDTGELRYALGSDGPLLAGRLTVSFNKDADTLGSDGNIKDAYVTLFNTDTSTSSGRAILDLRIQDDNFAIRDQDDITVANPFTPGEWQDVIVTWEAADDTSAPVLTVTIDGVDVTTEPYTGSATAVGGVTHVAFRFADNSRTVTGSYRVDDVAVYSDTAGTTLVFEDDFEGYTAGDSLGTDNANSPYNSSTFETVVAAED